MHRLTRSHRKAVARFWAWAVWSMEIQEQLTTTEDAAAQEGGQCPSALSPPSYHFPSWHNQREEQAHPPGNHSKEIKEGLLSAAWAILVRIEFVKV